MITTRDLAQLIVSTADANLNLPLSPCVGARAIDTVHQAMGAAISSQRLLRQAHAELEVIGRRIGLTEEMWGGGYPKDPPSAEPATLRASPQSVAAA
ncbi:hypothetical protein [uncultured Sphingomonas sp.]|uniref:hypothetical protein n=1 Tax=uncultured Sphingomonas sp. TaxID=158754 RepID=UPI002621F3DD|nr:hypothetical protein [uncultured Sphingomonas sp.]